MANNSLEDRPFNPILIRKSYEQQKNDLLKIINFTESTPWIDMKYLWKDDIEYIIDCVGWFALWKISRDACLKFNICYPTSVIVKVESIDYENLSTNVSLYMTEGDITLPQTISDVPMINLFPTIEQEYPDINSKRMANILHDLRVFFNHLWFPFDDKFNSNLDWWSVHFENRLKLYYDISVGDVDLKILNTIENLIKDGICLTKQINKIEEELLVVANAEEDMRSLLVSQLHRKLSDLYVQLTIYEKQSNRNLLRKQHCAQNDDNRQYVSVAWAGDNEKDHTFFFNKLNKILLDIDNRCFKGMWNFEEVICNASKTEKIYLAPGSFYLKSRTLLNNNNILQGIDGWENTMVTDSEEGLCVFETLSKDICINSITLATSNVEYGIIVCAGICNLKNMKIMGNRKGQTGIHVRSGAQLVAENCLFSGFSTAIYAKENSTVLLKNCTFQNNENGLEFKSSNITIESCKFTGNTGYALLMVQSKDTSVKLVEGSSALEKFEGVKLIDTTFDKNKCDTAVEYLKCR